MSYTIPRRDLLQRLSEHRDALAEALDELERLLAEIDPPTPITQEDDHNARTQD